MRLSPTCAQYAAASWTRQSAQVARGLWPIATSPPSAATRACANVSASVRNPCGSKTSPRSAAKSSATVATVTSAAFAPSACPPIPSTTTSSTAESLLRTSTRSWLSCRLPGRLSLAHSVRTTIFWCLRYVARAFRLEMTPDTLCGRPYRISAEYYTKWTSRCPVVYMLVRAARVVEPSSVADRLGSATPRSAGTDRYLATQHDWLRERRGARSAVPTHLGAAQRQSPLSRSRY